jgi:inositol oxygenase
LPNAVHAYQTAERLRELHPDKGLSFRVSVFVLEEPVYSCMPTSYPLELKDCVQAPPHSPADWLHLTGLIHDIGKVMSCWGQPQWSTVGDTFPVGCSFDSSIVHADTFANNPDVKNSKYK